MAWRDTLLKLEGIEGESKDKAHKNEIDIESYSFALSQTGTFGSGGERRSRGWTEDLRLGCQRECETLEQRSY